MRDNISTSSYLNTKPIYVGRLSSTQQTMLVLVRLFLVLGILLNMIKSI